MATSLFEYGKITTTIFKAKAVRPLVDRLVTLAKRGDLHSLRQAGAVLTKPKVLKKLFDEAKVKFQDRISGYTSMIRIGLRAGDVAPMVVLELLGPDSTSASRSRPGTKISDRSRRVAASRIKAAAAGQTAETQAVEPAPETAAPTAEPAENTAETGTAAEDAAGAETEARETENTEPQSRDETAAEPDEPKIG
jgi:large subunit ribosomal protein L17